MSDERVTCPICQAHQADADALLAHFGAAHPDAEAPPGSD
jgi:hypothetical protein